METLRKNKAHLREPDLSLVLAYERELKKVDAEQNAQVPPVQNG